MQYQETDFAFLSRLMEEEGIYYYISHEKTKDVLILADDASAHKALEDHAKLDFHFQEPGYRRRDDHVFEWRVGESIQTGKVTLQDYDFEKPKSDLKTVKALPQGKHAHKSYEMYGYPGRHRDTRTGEHLARVKVEGFAAKAHRARGTCNVRQMMAGGKFELKEHPRKAENAEYLVLSACHQLQIDADVEDREMVNAILGPLLDFDRQNTLDIYRCSFEVQPLDMAFRAPQITPLPTHPGVQTAVVVGKKGEEIWTDQYGRVKVQFHWDREGKRDDNSSCWIRTSVPWSGKGWGAIGVPRVGQEVVVQFEDGNPDRPIITGMVYNGDTRVPYALPANQTQFGFKTNSSKDGAASTSLSSRTRRAPNLCACSPSSTITRSSRTTPRSPLGWNTRRAAPSPQTIHGDKTETIREGNHSFTVAKGQEDVSIAKARQTQIGASDKLSVDADQTVLVKGAKSDVVNKDYEIDVGAALNVTAKSKIIFKCGSSTIEMTPTKVTISSTQIDFNAKATAKFSAGGQLKMEGKGQASLKGGGMLKLEGGGMTQVKSLGACCRSRAR